LQTSIITPHLTALAIVLIGLSFILVTGCSMVMATYLNITATALLRRFSHDHFLLWVSSEWAAS
jgi:hypothetical protein